MAILHPQECWLLERIMSPEYYRRRFEGWQEFVELCERQVAETGCHSSRKNSMTD